MHFVIAERLRAVDPQQFFKVMGEAKVPPDQLEAFLKDQTSCIIGKITAEKYHIKVGDRLPFTGTIWPCDLTLKVAGIYEGSIDDRKALTQSDQMLASRCYLESGGKLGCISCHNPHGLPEGEPAVYFDTKCANCHGASSGECSLSAAHRADRTCIGCHMPRFSLTDVPHTALTDHRILRRPDFSLKAASTPPPDSDVFEEGEPALPEWEVRRARALALRMDPSQVKTPEEIARAAETLRSLEPMLADDPEVSAMLAWLAGQQQDNAPLEKAARRTLELNPGRYEAQEQLLQALLGRQAWSEGETLCRELIAQDSSRAMYHALLADMLSKQGHVRDAIAAAEKSLACDPTQRGVRQRLIEMYRQSGDLLRANKHQSVLTRLPPRRP